MTYFILYRETILSELGVQPGFIIGGLHLNIRYADNSVDSSHGEELSDLLQKLKKGSEKKGYWSIE